VEAKMRAYLNPKILSRLRSQTGSWFISDLKGEPGRRIIDE